MVRIFGEIPGFRLVQPSIHAALWLMPESTVHFELESRGPVRKARTP